MCIARRSVMDERETTMSTMSMAEIYTALTEWLAALGNVNEQAAPREAAIMICGWDKFTDYDSMETGGRQCDRWMDPEVVRLLDAALNAHFLGGEPYPTAPA
jgi:hypothetical protein